MGIWSDRATWEDCGGNSHKEAKGHIESNAQIEELRVAGRTPMKRLMLSYLEEGKTFCILLHLSSPVFVQGLGPVGHVLVEGANTVL